MIEKQLNLGTIQMPVAAATKTFAILAQRGAGKSHTGAVLAEEFFEAGIPFVVFDPIDVWWGLRLDADGIRPGLPVVVFGAEHADVPLTADMGEQIAQAVVEQNVSCVLSTFGMPKAQQRKLIADFSEALLRTNRTPRHIFIEEAHEFIPQRIGNDMTRSFNAVNSLIVMGRNRGLGATLISQRAATVNKDALTQIDTLMAFRNSSPNDRAALRAWVEYHAAAGDFKAFMDSLPSLPTGEGWLWSPQFLDKFERIKIRRRRTFHPDPEKLQAGIAMPILARADVQTFIQQFAAPGAPMPVTRKRAVPVQTAKEVPTTWNVERQALVAEYEARLSAKDEEIRRLHAKLAAIDDILNDASLLAAVPLPPPKLTAPTVNQKVVEQWANRLGGKKNGAARILKYLAEMYPMNYTRSQLALRVNMTASGGSFNEYISTLLRNKMIVDQRGYLMLSADLIER